MIYVVICYLVFSCMLILVLCSTSMCFVLLLCFCAWIVPSCLEPGWDLGVGWSDVYSCNYYNTRLARITVYYISILVIVKL